MLKRVFDMTFALVGLILLSPFILFCAILIKLGSKGPVFYRGVRVGRYGKPFKIFKFRTMVAAFQKSCGTQFLNKLTRQKRMAKVDLVFIIPETQ